MSMPYRVFRYVPDEDKKVRRVDKDLRESALELTKKALKIAGLTYDGVFSTCSNESLALSASASIMNMLLRAPYLFAPTPPRHAQTHILWEPFSILLLNILKQYYECSDRLAYTADKLANIVGLISTARNFLESLGKKGENMTKLLAEVMMLLSDYETLDRGVRGFLLSPEDTRPGLNTSSVLAHLLITSGLVRPINDALSNVLGQDIALAEIVAMVHDIGKLIDYRRHVKAGMDFLREIKLEVLAKYVERHHDPMSNVMKVVNLADRIASNIDRELGIARDAVRNAINNLASEGKVVDKDALINLADRWFGGDWDAGDEFVRTLSKGSPDEESLLREFHRIVINEMNKLRAEAGVGGIGGGNIYLCTVDIGGIQRLINRGSRLRVITGASYLVRIINEVSIPLALISSGVGVSSIIVLKGGNVTFLTSSNNVGEVTKIINELGNELTRRYDIGGVYVACAPIASVDKDALDGGKPVVFSVPSAMDAISRELLRAKLKSALSIESKEFNPRGDRCSICGLRPATTKVEGEGMCDVCAWLNRIGYEYGLGSKMELIGISSMDPMDFMLEGYGKYALVRLDVNNAGEMLRSVVSLGELLDLSIHLEYSIKSAMQDTMLELNKVGGDLGLDDKFFLGLIYHGGDDAFLVLRPSIIPTLLRNIRSRIDDEGFSVGIGVVVTDKKHPLSMSFEAAHELMEKAKDLSKKYSRSIGRSTSFVSLLYVPNSLVVPNVVSTMLKAYAESYEGVTALPVGHVLDFLRDAYGGDDYVVRFVNDVERGDGDIMKEVVRAYHSAVKVLPSRVVSGESEVRALMVLFNLWKDSIECRDSEDCRPINAMLNIASSLRGVKELVSEYGGTLPFMNVVMLAKSLVKASGG